MVFQLKLDIVQRLAVDGKMTAGLVGVTQHTVLPSITPGMTLLFTLLFMVRTLLTITICVIVISEKQRTLTSVSASRALPSMEEAASQVIFACSRILYPMLVHVGLPRT